MRLLILAIITLAAMPAMAQQTPVFRNFIWGVSREDVRKYESATWYKSEGDSEFYVEKPDRFNRTIRYDFMGDKLWRAEISILDFSLPDPKDIFDRAADLQIELTKIYGKPKSEELIWSNRRFRPYPHRLNWALQAGDVKIRTTWEPPGSKVTMELYHDGWRYQLITKAEKINGPSMDNSRNILNLPLGDNSQP